MKMASTDVLLGFVLLFLCACGADETLSRVEQITAKIKTADGYYALTSWIDHNITQAALSADAMEVEVGTRERPASLLLKKKFDWGILKLHTIHPSEVRIACSRDGQWKQVYIGPVRYGVVINLAIDDLSMTIPGEVYRDRRIVVYHDD